MDRHVRHPGACLSGQWLTVRALGLRIEACFDDAAGPAKMLRHEALLLLRWRLYGLGAQAGHAPALLGKIGQGTSHAWRAS